MVIVDDAGVMVPNQSGWAMFDNVISQRLIPADVSASVAVLVDGELVHQAAFGVRVAGTGEPTEVTDRFRIASISKTITAIVIMQMVERGELTLDQPVGQILLDHLGVAPSDPDAPRPHGSPAAQPHLRLPEVPVGVLRQRCGVVRRRRPDRHVRSGVAGAGRVHLQQHELRRALGADRGGHRAGLRARRLRPAARAARLHRHAHDEHLRRRARRGLAPPTGRAQLHGGARRRRGVERDADRGGDDLQLDRSGHARDGRRSRRSRWR